MIRAIHARFDDSRFVDDVAQCGGKNPPTLGLVKIRSLRVDYRPPSTSHVTMCASRRSQLLNPEKELKHPNHFFTVHLSHLTTLNATLDELNTKHTR
jgi:hypothetical protein